MEIDLIVPAVGSPFCSTIVYGSRPLVRPFAHPVALYSSEDDKLLGYRIGISDHASRPEVQWCGLQSVIEGVLADDMDGWEEAVKEHLEGYLGAYIADG